MSEKDTIEVETSKKEKINEKINKGHEKVNDTLDNSKEKVEKKFDSKKEKLNDTIDQGKNIADKVASDLSKGVDGFFDNAKIVQQKVNDKINNYKKNITSNLDIDLVEDEKKYYIKVATPGVDKEDIEIEAGDYEISIEATFPSCDETIEADDDAEILIEELKSGECVKTITFANKIDIENIKATFNNGMVTITIPKVVTPKHKVKVE